MAEVASVTLSHLPAEIFNIIFQDLEVRDFLSLSVVSRYLRTHAQPHCFISNTFSTLVYDELYQQFHSFYGPLTITNPGFRQRGWPLTHIPLFLRTIRENQSLRFSVREVVIVLHEIHEYLEAVLTELLEILPPSAQVHLRLPKFGSNLPLAGNGEVLHGLHLGDVESDFAPENEMLHLMSVMEVKGLRHLSVHRSSSLTKWTDTEAVDVNIHPTSLQTSGVTHMCFAQYGFDAMDIVQITSIPMTLKCLWYVYRPPYRALPDTVVVLQSALDAQKDSLEEIYIDVEHIGRRFPESMRLHSLAAFGSLTRLGLSRSLFFELIAFDSDAVIEASQILPQTLQELQIQIETSADDFSWLCMILDDLGMMVEHLTRPATKLHSWLDSFAETYQHGTRVVLWRLWDQPRNRKHPMWPAWLVYHRWKGLMDKFQDFGGSLQFQQDAWPPIFQK